MIRDSYRQPSVLGGVFICNQALGNEQTLATTLEVIEPAEGAHYAPLYEEWKKARSSFKQILS